MIDRRSAHEVHSHLQNAIDSTARVCLYIDLAFCRRLPLLDLLQLVSHTIVTIASLFSFKNKV